MQALSFINRVPSKAEVAAAEKPPKRLAPRKPTENQLRTKFSKANLAYIVKTKGKQDARFKKDLARYYRNLEELISEFKL